MSPRKKKPKKRTLGLVETAKLKLPHKKTLSVKGKIDTGAYRTAIDVSLAKKMGFEKTWRCFNKYCPKLKITRRNYKTIQKMIKTKYKDKLLEKCPGLENVKVVPATNGFSIRPYIKIQYYLKNKKITSVASITRRQHMQFLMLIGKEDLKGFIIIPEKNDYGTLEKLYEE